MASQLTVLKRRVTAYFKKRRQRLATITGAGLAADDYFELFVLVALVRGRNMTVHPPGKRFVVAASPSASWSKASYFQYSNKSGTTFALRTGLQVQDATAVATVELDVVAVDVTAGLPAATTPALLVRAAFECKAHKTFTLTKANEVIGKAMRVWNGMPMAVGTASAYAVVSTAKFDPSAEKVLHRLQIRCVSTSVSTAPVNAYAALLVPAL